MNNGSAMSSPPTLLIPKKLYFPCLAILLSAVVSGLMNFAISFSVFIAMIYYYRIISEVNIVWLPALMIMVMATVLGVGFWFSAMKARFRDALILD